MNKNQLKTIAKKIAQPGKGLLAADESTGTANKRLKAIGVAQTPNNRRLYRDLFLTAPGINKYLSGVILYDETIRQKDSTGKRFIDNLKKKNIIPGIKVDAGSKDLALFPGEEVTEGLDDLRLRLKEYYALGARFAKWRAVIKIDTKKGLPTDQALKANAHALARYAGLCQEANIVPIVEPEVLINGTHSLEQSEKVLTRTLKIMFKELKEFNVYLPGVVLKSSMALPGNKSKKKVSDEQIAKATLRAFKNSVPKEIQSIVFLSGGQKDGKATDRLQSIASMGGQPWSISYSFAREFQRKPLEIWGGKVARKKKAQEEFIDRLQKASKAQQGILGK